MSSSRRRWVGAGTSVPSLAVVWAGVLAGCQGLTGPDGTGASYEPVWITASWVVRAPNEAPGDRTDREPADWKGSLCPARSVLLSNADREPSLFTIKNNCAGTMVTYAMCVNSGLDTNRNELKSCAVDPLQTAWDQLTFTTLTPGPYGNFYNSTRILTVQVFYCSTELTLTAPPLSDRIECVE